MAKKATAAVAEPVGNGRREMFNEQQVDNGARRIVEYTKPYIARFELLGTVPIIFHKWDCESIEGKSKAAKGSKAKKTDDVESYVFRTAEGHIGMPGMYIVAALCDMGRSMQDPRSPRKSMRDLLRAVLIPLPTPDHVWPFLPNTKEWDYLDKRRVVVQRNALTRLRPAFTEGWRIKFEILVNTPEYLAPERLNQLISETGRLNGLADGRPSYGRFTVSAFEAAESFDE